MFDFLNGITQKIVVLITAITISVTSIFGGNSSPIPSSTPTPTSETVITPSASPIPSITPKATSPKDSPQVLGDTKSDSVSNINQSQQKIYPITPIGDLSNLSPIARQQMTEIYNEFLQIPNLQYLTPQQQDELFKQLASKYLDRYKSKLEQERNRLQENINRLQTETYMYPTPQSYIPTPTPTPTPYYSSEIESALSQLNQTFTDIESKPVAMEVIEGRKDRAYQDWVNGNQSLYTTIQNTHYKARLNAILTAHGMWWYTLQ